MRGVTASRSGRMRRRCERDFAATQKRSAANIHQRVRYALANARGSIYNKRPKAGRLRGVTLPGCLRQSLAAVRWGSYSFRRASGPGRPGGSGGCKTGIPAIPPGSARSSRCRRSSIAWLSSDNQSLDLGLFFADFASFVGVVAAGASEVACSDFLVSPAGFWLCSSALAPAL